MIWAAASTKLAKYIAAIVLGDYLYIAGGELAQTVDGALSIYPRTSGSTYPIAPCVHLTLH